MSLFSVAALLLAAVLTSMAGAESTTKNANANEFVVKAWQPSHAAEHLRRGWRVHGALTSAEEMSYAHKFTVYLTHDASALRDLTRVHTAVSDPTHADYGKHLSKEQLDKLLRNDARHERVMAWLRAAGVERVVSHGDALQCDASPQAIRRAFNGAQLSWISHVASSQDSTSARVARVLGDVAVPAALADDVEFVAGLTEQFGGDAHRFKVLEASRQKRKADRASSAADAAAQPQPQRKCGKCEPMVPQTLRKYYNVSSSLAASGLYDNKQAVSAFEETFSAKGLAIFGKQIAKSQYPFKVSATPGAKLDPTNDATEGSLDVQYIMAMGQNVPTWFWAVQYSYWILEWTLDVLGQQSPPLVHSLSYGTSIEHQCDIASSWCGVLGYNSTAYAVRTGVELQKLGARGVTVLVSSGDNGAPGRANNGHCPLQEYCPLGGCQYSSSACQSVSLSINKQGLVIDCILPLGIGGYGCAAMASMLQIAPQNFSQIFDVALDFLQNDVGVQAAAWDVDVEGNPHLYVPRGHSCASINYLTTIDNGLFTFSGFVFNASDIRTGQVFIDEYPGSSSFITSVGATGFNSSSDPEQADSILNGGIITTGGGFSTAIDQPAYQASAVAQYFNTVPASRLPDPHMYNAKMRAYPDIAFAGERYVVVLDDGTGQFKTEEVSGTSASSPALAGLLSLINEQRLAQGLGALGFLNPLLYRAATVAPQVFNDVTEGSNRCTNAYCCQFGWPAAPGYDLSTGLGSINFGLFYDFATQ